MSFCPNCGAEQPAAAIAEAEAIGEAAADVAAEVAPAEVEIARIQADRDIALAKIGAGVEIAAVEATADTEAAADHARAEILEEILEPPAPEAPAGDPVVVVAGDAGEAEAGDVIEDEGAPPELEDAPAAAVPARGRNPWW